MKTIKIGLFLFLCCTQLILCSASQSTVQIVKVTPIDAYGNTNYYLNRGFQAGATVELNSPSNGNYSITVSLSDSNNVPVGITTENISISTGANNVTLYFKVANYAYIGLGNLHVSILNSDNSPVISCDLTVAIQILGDFNKDGRITSSDVTFFIAAYQDYCATQSISPEYRVCDINGDGKLDSLDIAAFVCACAIYFNSPTC